MAKEDKPMTSSEMGKKGARIRMEKLSAGERKRIASKAAKARWKKKRAEKKAAKRLVTKKKK